jgi:hypothetical protein
MIKLAHFGSFPLSYKKQCDCPDALLPTAYELIEPAKSGLEKTTVFSWRRDILDTRGTTNACQAHKVGYVCRTRGLAAAGISGALP